MLDIWLHTKVLQKYIEFDHAQKGTKTYRKISPSPSSDSELQGLQKLVENCSERTNPEGQICPRNGIKKELCEFLS